MAKLSFSFSDEPLLGCWVDLEPLKIEHIPKLEGSYSPELSEWYPRQFSSVQDYYDGMVRDQEFGEVRLFAIYDKRIRQYLGCTGFLCMDPKNKKLEIGASWIGGKFQGSVANTEAKLLLLMYAFERLGCIRVEFYTDSLNVRSQHALERLGAVKEGLLRNHKIVPSGRRRHSVVFGVIVEEWSDTKKIIQNRLNAKGSTEFIAS